MSAFSRVWTVYFEEEHEITLNMLVSTLGTSHKSPRYRATVMQLLGRYRVMARLGQGDRSVYLLLLVKF